MAMIPSNYMINIAKPVNRGSYVAQSHFASVELGACLSEEAVAKFGEFETRFPVTEGWHLTLTKVTCYGEEQLTNQVFA